MVSESKKRIALGGAMQPHSESERFSQTDEAVEKAKKAAFRLLGARAYTRFEIVKKLKTRGFEDCVVEATLQTMEGMKLVDDADFALRFVQEKLRLRPMGRSMLVRELKKRGISDQNLVEEVLEVALSDVEPEALALELLRGRRKRYYGLERQKAFTRMFGFLGRRGFSGSDAHSAVERAWTEFQQIEE
jgi:regulatory protein